jgi:hypothetical protein
LESPSMTWYNRGATIACISITDVSRFKAGSAQ